MALLALSLMLSAGTSMGIDLAFLLPYTKNLFFKQSLLFDDDLLQRRQKWEKFSSPESYEEVVKEPLWPYYFWICYIAGMKKGWWPNFLNYSLNKTETFDTECTRVQRLLNVQITIFLKFPQRATQRWRATPFSNSKSSVISESKLHINSGKLSIPGANVLGRGWQHLQVGEGSGVLEAPDVLVADPRDLALAPLAGLGRPPLVLLPFLHGLEHVSIDVGVVDLVRRLVHQSQLVRNSGIVFTCEHACETIITVLQRLGTVTWHTKRRGQALPRALPLFFFFFAVANSRD